MHAAKNYNCNITTTTISDAQFEFASSRIREEGLESQIKVINKDYRELDGGRQSAYVVKERVPVYPDTLSWIHDFTYHFTYFATS